MSVLIKGMRMPHDCFECPLSIPPVSDDSPLWMCGGNAMSIHEASTEERRPYNCPLVEVSDGQKEWLDGMNVLYGDEIAEAERTCGNCKWSVGKDKPETYVVCKNKDRYVIPKAVDMFNKGCERWEKEI